MKYWNDMITKYGFSDGEQIPPEAEDSRDIYVYAINLLAEQMELQGRVIAYDRGGMHNHIMVLPKDDNGWPDKAIEIAETLGLDDYIVVDVSTLKDELDDFLSNNLDSIIDESDDLTTIGS